VCGLPLPGVAHGRYPLPWYTFHGVSPKHLQRYLDEYSYRFDRRWREGELFGFVLRRVARGKPLPYRQLVAERTA
jgi:hypothetical protein